MAERGRRFALSGGEPAFRIWRPACSFRSCRRNSRRLGHPAIFVNDGHDPAAAGQSVAGIGLALLLVVLLLGNSPQERGHWLVAISLACVLALEHTWHNAHFQRERRCCRSVGIWFLCCLYRFSLCLPKRPAGPNAALGNSHVRPASFLPGVSGCVARISQFVLGLLPAAFALPPLLGLIWLADGFLRLRRRGTLFWPGLAGAHCFCHAHFPDSI